MDGGRDDGKDGAMTEGGSLHERALAHADVDRVRAGGRPLLRSVAVGGSSKTVLLARLREHGVQLNAAARMLFAHDRFTTAADRTLVETVELAVGALGCPEGASIDRIYERAAALGLAACPLELGPHLRLQWLAQPEGRSGTESTRHRAPPDSVTIASAALVDDDRVPKGFYLRRLGGVAWLRGYWSDARHVWSPEDRLVFRRCAVES
jgi:hypothetical protein